MPSRDARYYALIRTRRWRMLRIEKLSETPWCEECLRHGRLRGATEVHHITPIQSAGTMQGMAALAYDKRNLMSVCEECHLELHRRMGSLKGMDKEALKEDRERQIEDYLKRLKDGTI